MSDCDELLNSGGLIWRRQKDLGSWINDERFSQFNEK